MKNVSNMWRGIAVIVACLTSASFVLAQDEFENPPIEYSKQTPHNRVSDLQSALEKGTISLQRDEQTGYLRSLLEHLQVPVESQVLVYSKTSLQISRISPKVPRAIYFSDDISVGYVASGDMLEITAVDPQLGMVFYSLDQDPEEVPALLRQSDRCLTCHSSTRTNGVPGLLARSMIVDLKGNPIFSAGSANVDHRTPFEKRWGGWYVTGTHGDIVHQGNFVSKTRTAVEPIDNSAGQNRVALPDHLSTDRYLTTQSDIVALMVLEHQVLVQNRLTKANFTTQEALHYQQIMSGPLAKGPGVMLDSVARRINSVADDLVDALLLVDEATITSPIAGTSGFAERFASSGVRDSQGRSLRDLDLKRRLFRYPCSFLIDSTAFHALPDAVKTVVWTRLDDILSGRDSSEKYQSLSTDDRIAIREILIATHPGVPESWKTTTSAE